ncbi:MAG: prepilin-type N-terminal cleavage/methylation domain-containing protein [Thermodesulfobacteriota bacterium]
MRVPVRRKPSGFTLVEMAIVLVIIGIILAGVMKGRDIVRGSQVKQFSQQFAQKWATIAQTYYDKTGQFFNDGNVNGGTGTTATNPANGRMDGFTLSAAGSTALLQTLENVGIPVCSLLKSKLVSPVARVNVVAATVPCRDSGAVNILNPWQTNVDGEYSGSVLVEADLVALLLDLNGNNVLRNCVVLYNVPVDVALGLDTAIDGKADATSGTCVAISNGRAITASATTLAEGADVTAIMPVAWADPSNTAATGLQDVAIVLDF